MFDCSACLIRTFRLLAVESSVATRRRRPAISAPRPARHISPQPRHYSDVVPSNGPGERYLNAAQIRHRDLKANVEQQAVPKSSSSGLTHAERQLQKELVYLKDPLKLADHVRHLVFRGEEEKAVALCRLASKTMDSVVAWNHVVDGHMRAGRIKEGIKFYNEMKKRAQHPDSYTYLLLLRSLATRDMNDRHHSASTTNASRAVSIYNSMSSPASKVKPAIIHTNAALKACSQSTDMDAFWGIVAQLPENGPNCADRITYTIILQAIKHGAAGDFAAKTSPDERRARRRQAADEGRKIWQQVVAKWQSGVLSLDEPLVHAMARVLMQSPDIADWDNVFDLIQQTTSIDRPIPRIGSPERSISHVPDQGEGKLDRRAPHESAHDEARGNMPLYRVFWPLKQAAALQSGVKFVTPDNAILSVALDAATMMRAQKAAVSYWDVIINKYGVRPDATNFHAFLRQLALNRASSQAVAVLRQMVTTTSIRSSERTFILAMNCCIRDKKNPSALKSALEVLDVMNHARGQPSGEVLQLFVELISASEQSAHKIPAIDRLLLELGEPDHIAKLDGGVELLRSAAGCVHGAILADKLPDEVCERWQHSRGRFNQAITATGTCHSRSPRVQQRRTLPVSA